MNKCILMWQKCFQNSLLNNSAYDDGLFKNNLPYVIIFNIDKALGATWHSNTPKNDSKGIYKDDE
ncbi:hypothetical protein JTS98_05825 [Clostridium botulinum]|nr:hypothetical protein [Clostridium botulinum]